MILFLFAALFLIWISAGFGLFVNYKNSDFRIKQVMRMLWIGYIVAAAIAGFLMWVELIVKEVENG